MVTKGEIIVLRISTDDKTVIKNAADANGKSLTTFIVEASRKQADRSAKHPPARGVHGGLPTWFRATCREAAHGGALGYENVGWKLAGSVGGEIPIDIETDDWVEEVKVLTDLLADREDESVWKWFKQHYPRLIALVPTRRRDQFLDGVRRAYKDGDIVV